MQFDFLKNLFVKRDRPVPREAKPVAFALKVSAPPEEPLLACARALLQSAGADALAARLRIEWNARMRSPTQGYYGWCNLRSATTTEPHTSG